MDAWSLVLCLVTLSCLTLAAFPRYQLCSSGRFLADDIALTSLHHNTCNSCCAPSTVILVQYLLQLPSIILYITADLHSRPFHYHPWSTIRIQHGRLHIPSTQLSEGTTIFIRAPQKHLVSFNTFTAATTTNSQRALLVCRLHHISACVDETGRRGIHPT